MTRLVLFVGHPASGLTLAAFFGGDEEGVVTLPRLAPEATLGDAEAALDASQGPSAAVRRRFFAAWACPDGGRAVAFFQATPAGTTKASRWVVAPLGGTAVHCQESFYHLPVDQADLAALAACPACPAIRPGRLPPEQAWVMYHGTPTPNLGSILREGLRPTARGMEGRGVYLGVFLKAVRFAMFSTYWSKHAPTSHRREGSVLRCVAVGTRAGHKALDASGRRETPCGCRICVRDLGLGVSSALKQRLVDHRGAWATRDGFQTLWVPPCEWAPGKRIVSTPELVVADPRQVHVVCARDVDMATRGEDYEPGRDDHRVIL